MYWCNPEICTHATSIISEGNIVPFRGVSKSGTGTIIHADGAGRGPSGIELQHRTGAPQYRQLLGRQRLR